MPDPGRIRAFKSFEGSKRVLSQLPDLKTFDIHQRQSASRPKTKARGYGRKWDSYRRWYLRQHPLCVRCGGLAELVDHIKAIRFGGSKTDPLNHQPLCLVCHAAKTRAEEAEASALGLVPLWGKGVKSSAESQGKPPGCP